MAGPRVLVDTGPLVALMNRRDRHHRRFVDCLRSFEGEYVTAWPVLTEVAHQIPVPRALDIVALAEQGVLQVIDLPQAAGRIRQLMRKYADRPMDLADASLVWAAEQTGIDRILTIDADFSIFRLADGRRLQLLP